MKNKFLLLTLFIFTIPFYAQGYKIGDIAQDFNLKNIDGQMVSLNDYKTAKGVLVVFTCNHCPFSIANEDRLIALDKTYKNKGVPVVAINPNNSDIVPQDSFKNMQIRAKDKGFTFPYLQDKNQEVFPIYGAKKTPHVYLLANRKNHFEVVYIGAIDNSSRHPNKVTEHYVQNAIDALLSDKEIPITVTKAIGCSIIV